MVPQVHLRPDALTRSGDPRVGVLPTAMGELRLHGTSQKCARGWPVAPGTSRRYPNPNTHLLASCQVSFSGPTNGLDPIREGGRLELGLSPEAHT